MEKNITDKTIPLLIQLYWIIISLICINEFSGDGVFFEPLGYTSLISIMISFVLNKFHIVGIILFILSFFIDLGLFLVIGFAHSLPILIICLLYLIMILNICTSIYLIKH